MNAGHNSNEALKAIGERINKMMDVAEEAKQDISEIYKEAKSNGHDVKALREAVKRQREDADKKKKRLELEEMVETYTAALGGLRDLPLGRAAIENITRAG